MDIETQKRIARDWGFNLCAEYRGNNGARVIPHTIWESAFDGSQMVGYRASHPDMNDGKFAEGDMTPNSLRAWIGK